MTSLISHTVYASAILDCKIEDDPDKYRFSIKENLPVSEKNILVSKLNRFCCFIKKIDESSSKVIQIARLIITLVLLLSIIGIAFVVLANRARDLIQDNKDKINITLQGLNKNIDKWNKRAKLMESTALDQIGIPYFEKTVSDVNQIQLTDLTNSILKGKDLSGRAFFILHLKDKAELSYLIRLVQSTEPDLKWSYKVEPSLHMSKNETINTFIKKVILSNHSQFTLS